MHLADSEAVPDVLDRMHQTRLHRQPLLFAIARDAHTILATWNINWRTIFENTLPADRQVYLQLIDRDGVTETTVAVEPMSAMHYVTISGLHKSYHVEIGYFQPVDSWRLIARSEAVEMPPHGNIALTDVDLATIPFHLKFQQLANLFGATNGAPVARILGNFQSRALKNSRPNEATRSASQTLRDLKLSLSEMTAAERDFKKIDAEKLARRARASLPVAATSPIRVLQRKFGS